MWNPPRFPGLSGVASQTGPKGGCHTRRESGSPLLGRCRGGATFSPFRPYLWCTPADGGRARPLPPRPEALVEGVETASGVETAQRCAQPSNRPHQAQGRLGPQPGKRNKNMGFPKGSPFGGSLVTFCPSESHPSASASPFDRLSRPHQNDGKAGFFTRSVYSAPPRSGRGSAPGSPRTPAPWTDPPPGCPPPGG